MILVDYSAISIAVISMQKTAPEEDLIRHQILNSVRSHRAKHKKKFGEVVICCDAGGNWRKEFYPEYKANRQTRRDENPEYWKEVFRIINLVKDELIENFPYRVVQVWGCEADDVVASLVESTQEFGKGEPVLIVSHDRDFAQLQRYSNVQQFSTKTKSFLVDPDPRKSLFEHICKGDAGDGVPNIMSHDKTFVNEERQSRLTSKKIEEWYGSVNGIATAPPDVYRNFQRNRRMIDLSLIPAELKEKVINTYEATEVAPKSRVLPFLAKKRCRRLIESIEDFVS